MRWQDAMRWVRSATWIATRVIWRGTWQAHSVRLIWGLLFSGLAALLSFWATGRPSALVGVVAYPAGLILIFGFDTIRWRTGWHWRFGREWPVQANGVLQLTILARGPMQITPAREREEGSCIVYGPDRRKFEAAHVRAISGQGYCFYPQDFSGAPPATAGTYWVMWLERKPIWKAGEPQGFGEWYPIDFYRIKITSDQLATPVMVTPNETATDPAEPT
jgi:hypothetical protein